MVPTDSIRTLLEEKDFASNKLVTWSRGVDQTVFFPHPHDESKFPRMTSGPIYMYVGRVSSEKGVEDFLKLPLTNSTKYVVGIGPDLIPLQNKYSDATYLGYLEGDDLASAYSNADVLVFPSKTDTFGNTVIEALASGTPVAAFRALGAPVDVIEPNPKLGSVNDDLEVAIHQAYSSGDGEECVDYIIKHNTWQIATDQFLDNLVPVHDARGMMIKCSYQEVYCFSYPCLIIMMIAYVLSRLKQVTRLVCALKTFSFEKKLN